MIWAEIKGDVALHRKLKRLERKLQVKHVRASLRQAAKPILQAARSKAPRKTGFLGSAKGLRLTSVRRRDKGLITVAVHASASIYKKLGRPFYTLAVEYGTKRMKAQAFLRPAAEAGRSQAVGIYQRELGQRIDAEMRK